MPNNDATNAAIINYAGQVASSGINAMATSKLNKKTMRYNDEWAYRQREWALQDWKMQNEYNSPAEQRKRLIEANLNPALLYGKGAGDLTSGPVRAGSSPNWNPSAPRLEIGAQSSLLTYLGVQKQTAEIDQMNIQNDLLREKLNTQKGLTQLTWDRSKFTQSENEKLSMWISAAKAYAENPDNRSGGVFTGSYYGDLMYNQVLKSGVDISNSIDENERREMYAQNNTASVLIKAEELAIKRATSSAQIEAIRQNVKLAQQSEILKGFEIDGERFLKNIGPAAQLIRAIVSPGKK